MIDRRLERLERGRPNEKPFMFLQIGLEDDGLYHGPDGITYDEAAKAGLEDRYRLIIIEYTGNWPPGDEATA